MKIFNGKKIEIGIHKSGRREPFHFRPVECPHLHSMAEMRWDADDTYKATYFFIPHLVQIFWLWFIFYIKIKPEKLSEGKYVRYEATHFAAFNDALRDDKI